MYEERLLAMSDYLQRILVDKYGEEGLRELEASNIEAMKEAFAGLEQKHVKNYLEDLPLPWDDEPTQLHKKKIVITGAGGECAHNIRLPIDVAIESSTGLASSSMVIPMIHPRYRIPLRHCYIEHVPKLSEEKCAKELRLLIKKMSTNNLMNISDNTKKEEVTDKVSLMLSDAVKEYYNTYILTIKEGALPWRPIHMRIESLAKYS